jgi:hypothetical protein
MTDKSSLRRIRIFLVLALCLSGALLLLASVLPFGTLKPLVDSLGKDGDVELFSRELFNSVKLWLGLAGLILLLLGGSIQFARRSAERALDRVIAGLYRFARAFPGDVRQVAGSLRQLGRPRIYMWAVLALSLAAAVNFGLFLSQPMRYDESYTVLAFAIRPMRYVISDYHLPNNHVFHTILVHLAYNLLGSQPWIVRLPAYLAGVLAVPVTYVVASQFYNRPTGLLSAAMLAVSPELLDYATNARGYTLVVLFTLLILALAAYLRKRNNTFAWMLFVLFSALGFYTIPIMIFPFGMVMTWLLLSWLFKDVGTAYGTGLDFVKYLFVAGMAVVVLTAIFYLPIFWSSGVESVLGNRFVSALEWDDFSESVFVRFHNTWRAWNKDVLPIVGWVTLLGAGVGIVFHAHSGKTRAPLWLAALVWIGGVLVARQVAPWPRVWLFLLPLFLMWASAGMVIAGQALLARWELPRLAFVLAALALTAWLSVNLFQIQSANFFKNPGNLGEAEEMTVFIQQNLNPEDVVVVVIPLNYPTRYYFNRYGIADKYLCGARCPADFERALVVVNEREGQTLESVLDKVHLSGQINLDSEEVIHEYASTKLYAFKPKRASN